MTVRVGIDYDEPIFPWYDYAHDAAMDAGLASADQDPPTMWDPTSVYGCHLDDWWKVINREIQKGPRGMYARPIKPGVSAQLKRLVNRGFEVHVITARGTSGGSLDKQIQRLTKLQVAYELPFVTGLHFAKDKSVVISDLGIRYFLDDRESHFHEASQGGAASYLLDERWNQDTPTEYRVFSTREYVDAVIRREGGA